MEQQMCWAERMCMLHQALDHTVHGPATVLERTTMPGIVPAVHLRLLVFAGACMIVLNDEKFDVSSRCLFASCTSVSIG